MKREQNWRGFQEGHSHMYFYFLTCELKTWMHILLVYLKYFINITLQ